MMNNLSSIIGANNRKQLLFYNSKPFESKNLPAMACGSKALPGLRL